MRPAVSFTKDETVQIETAARAVEYFASTTNWTDSTDYRAAYKLVRKESDSKTEANARMVKAWHAGVTAARANASIATFPHSHATWYRLAFTLGLKQYGERATVPSFNDAHALCPAAIDAYESAMERWHELPWDLVA